MANSSQATGESDYFDPARPSSFCASRRTEKSTSFVTGGGSLSFSGAIKSPVRLSVVADAACAHG
ncbi:MAG: hypothetical protein ACREQA_02355 [Candidatus Binatia bacterium]